MTAPAVPSLSAPGGVPAALTAFLRGVERRAAVCAELLCGNPAAGDEAVAVAMRAFRNTAVQAPVADWPRRFWGLLLAVPQLREPAVTAHWPSEFAMLSRLPAGLRASLLLRLVAGLDERQAAAALRVELQTYRRSLRQALPRHLDGSPDPLAWHALGNALQHALRHLAAARLVHLAKLREDAIVGRKGPPHAQRGGRQRASAPPPRWVPTMLWSALAAAGLAFFATFVPSRSSSGQDAVPRIHRAALPELPPASRFDAALAVLAHPDFDQMLDTRDEALIRDLDVYAWYAARLATAPGAPGQLLPDAGQPVPEDLDAAR